MVAIYTYDNSGNILSKTVNGTQTNYGYNGFILTNYNGKNFSYSVTTGLPTVYRGEAMTWTKGRKLASYLGNTFAYDGRGKRIAKNSTNYYYDINDNLVYSSDGFTYYYDNDGVIGCSYNGKDYVYVKDIQGNICAILDENGAAVVIYAYDAWGKHRIMVSSSATNEQIFVALYNPFRYRGYFYDVETQLYYLNSRYYDPDLCRFVNRDNVAFADSSTLGGLNLYSYCNNNPMVCSLGCYLGETTSAPINGFGLISSYINSKSRSISNKSISNLNTSSSPFANIVTMTNYSTSLVDNIFFGMFFGNISHTTTTQHNNAGVFYAYTNIGNSTSSAGVGINFENWFGANLYVSSNIGIGSSIQITPSVTLGAEVSLLDGVSLSFGTTSENVTNETTVNIGWGTLATAYVACGVIATSPAPFARAIAGIAVCVVFFIDIFY